MRAVNLSIPLFRASPCQLRLGATSDFGSLPSEVEELGKCKRTLDGDFVGTNINRKLWQIFRAQLTGVWPYTRAEEGLGEC